MSDRPSVSIVIPWNDRPWAGESIRRTIAEIRALRFGHTTEIVRVGAWWPAYGATIHIPYHGTDVGEMRRLGAMAATGYAIAFVDSDDYHDPRLFWREVRAVLDGANVAAHDTVARFDVHTRDVRYFRSPAFPTNLVSCVISADRLRAQSWPPSRTVRQGASNRSLATDSDWLVWSTLIRWPKIVMRPGIRSVHTTHGENICQPETRPKGFEAVDDLPTGAIAFAERLRDQQIAWKQTQESEQKHD